MKNAEELAEINAEIADFEAIADPHDPSDGAALAQMYRTRQAVRSSIEETTR